MNKSAILHIPLSQYAFAKDDHTLVIRLRAEKGDIKRCRLFYGDRVDPRKQIQVKELTMDLTASDDLFDYFEAEIYDKYTRVCYYFLLDDGKVQEYYYERNFCKEITDNRTEYFQFPYIRREDIISMPDWVQDIVMYHIFPDSFASEKGCISKNPGKTLFEGEKESVTHLGGTLSGVKENLDYLKDLGVNCIYLNPIFAANSYHKYDTIDYFSIDPCFGTMEDVKELVQECHKNGIRVILDGVFNHSGADFFAFRDVLEKGTASRYYDWFYEMPEHISYTDPPSYEAFAYVKEMPKLNTGNKEVEDYFIRVGVYWIKEADIDGWRLDVANEINHDFWRHYRDAIKHVKPDAFMIGEIWEDAGEWLKGDQFDSTMNYRFSYLCRDFFARRSMTVSEFDQQIQKMIMRYPEVVSLSQMNFLDSHDVVRFLTECDGDRCRLELAMFYLIMGVGIPSIFYGDEYYIEGATEPEYRRAMPWGQKENCCGKLKRWIVIRKEHSAIRNGRYRTIMCDNQNEIYAFARENDAESILIVINNSKKDYNYRTDVCRKRLDMPEAKVQMSNENIYIPAMSGQVYLMHNR